MPDVTISYKGNSIATMSASGSKTLLTEGKYCEDDITIDYTAPTPSAGSATTPNTNIPVTPTITVSSSGLITTTVNTSQSVTPTVVAGYVSSGTAGTITVSGSNSDELTTKTAQTYTPTTTNQTISSGQYLTGTQTILGDANLLAENIKKDVSVFGVTGTYEGSGGGSMEDIIVRCSSASFPNTVASYAVISADIDAIISKIQNNDYVSGILYYTGYNSNEEEYRYDGYKLGYIHAYEDASGMEVRFWAFKTTSPYYVTKTMIINADGTVSYVN